MKFAFCVFKYFPFGGLERNCLNMAKEAAMRGHQVDLFCMKYEGDVPDNVNVNIVDVFGHTNHGRAKRFYHKVCATIKKSSYDLVVGFNRMPGLDLFYAADTCYESDVRNNHSWVYKMLRRYRIYAAFEKAVYAPASSTHILSIVDIEKRSAQDLYQTPAERFHDIGPGISRDRQAGPHAKAIRETCRQHFGVNVNEKTILFVGSDFQRKGLDRLLFAFAALPKAVRQTSWLWIVGKDNPSAYLQSAKKLDILDRIRFLGPQKLLPRILFSADILVHPARKEATGGVLLEGLVAGLPVIASAVCGFAFHVKQAKAGVVLPDPFMQRDLDHALIEMLTSPEFETLKQNAKTYGQTEDVYSRAQQAVDVMERLAKEKGVKWQF